MKYIDAEKLKAEIERQMKFYNEKEMKAWEYSEQGDEDALWYQGHRKMCAKLLTFIDSLSEEEPYSVSISPMKEWSEEDEEMLEYVIGDVNDAKQLFATKSAIDLCDKEIAWLKSLRPSWKPSEEQMSMLLAVINDPNNAGAESCQLSLKSLYEQLSKRIRYD